MDPKQEEEQREIIFSGEYADKLEEGMKDWKYWYGHFAYKYKKFHVDNGSYNGKYK